MEIYVLKDNKIGVEFGSWKKSTYKEYSIGEQLSEDLVTYINENKGINLQAYIGTDIITPWQIEVLAEVEKEAGEFIVCNKNSKLKSLTTMSSINEKLCRIEKTFGRKYNCVCRNELVKFRYLAIDIEPSILIRSYSSGTMRIEINGDNINNKNIELSGCIENHSLEDVVKRIREINANGWCITDMFSKGDTTAIKLDLLAPRK